MQLVGIDIDPWLAIRTRRLRPLQNVTVMSDPCLTEFGLIAKRGPDPALLDVVAEINR